MIARSESGFSVMELMLAAFLTVGLMGIIFAIVNQNQAVFVTETSVTDMNQNVRTGMDMLTRDIQSAGMGLPCGVPGDNFAAIYYTNGAGTAADSVLMLNGDPFGPTAAVTAQAGSTFTVDRPLEVPVPTPVNGTSQVYTYIGEDNAVKVLYDDYTADPRRYLVYDNTHAMSLKLTTNGVSVAPNTSITLTRTAAAADWVNPATVFGSALDLGQPLNYTDRSTKIAVLSSEIGYRLNVATRELERTENLINWFPLIRGVIGFQIRYRVVRIPAVGASEEMMTDSPGDGVTAFPSGVLTTRRDINSLLITLVAETPDVDPANPNYRRLVHRFEVTPRNLSMGRQL